MALPKLANADSVKLEVLLPADDREPFKRTITMHHHPRC